MKARRSREDAHFNLWAAVWVSGLLLSIGTAYVLENFPLGRTWYDVRERIVTIQLEEPWR